MSKVKITIVILILIATTAVIIFLLLKANEIQKYVMAYYPQIEIKENTPLLTYFERLLHTYLGMNIK